MNPFASIYEVFENILGFFNQDYAFIFTEMFNGGGYNQMGFIVLLIPMLSLSIFYFLWKYPYGRFVHWLIFIILIAIIVSGSTYGSIRIVLVDFILNPASDVSDFAQNLVIKYAILNGFLSLVISFFLSLLLRSRSKIQMHLPF